MAQQQLRKDTPAPDMDFSFTTELKGKARALGKGAKTKTSIEVALCECLEVCSLSDLTIAKICACAKVSHGTFYIYFTNRNALVVDVLLRFSDFVQCRMLQASRDMPDRPARAATSAYAHLFEQNLGLMKCLLRHLDDFPPAQAAFQDLNREWLETVVHATARHLRQSGSPVARDELMRRAYALGGMTDQYLAALLLDKDPNMQPFSCQREVVIDTLSLLWERGMSA